FSLRSLPSSTEIPTSVDSSAVAIAIAIVFPSGDHAGAPQKIGAYKAGIALLESTFAPLPSAFATTTDECPGVGSLQRVNAIRFPSGENVTELSMPFSSSFGVPPRIGISYKPPEGFDMLFIVKKTDRESGENAT